MSEKPGRVWLVDLDGVVWLSGQPLPGATEAVGRLRSAGRRVLFVTNNAGPTIDALLGRLGRAGIDAAAGDLVTAAMAAAGLVQAGEKVFMIGEGGLEEALLAAGAVLCGPEEASTVVVGWDSNFDFRTIASASSAIRLGARFVATNEDPTHPSPFGILPGTGSLVAAIATAAHAEPVVAGKPHEALVTLVQERLDPGEAIEAVVGDRPSTDGSLAKALSVPFGLVVSDATKLEGVAGDAAYAFGPGTLMDVVCEAIG